MGRGSFQSPGLTYGNVFLFGSPFGKCIVSSLYDVFMRLFHPFTRRAWMLFPVDFPW